MLTLPVQVVRINLFDSYLFLRYVLINAGTETWERRSWGE